MSLANWLVPAWQLWGLTKKFTLASRYIYIYSDALIESDTQARQTGLKETRLNTSLNEVLAMLSATNILNQRISQRYTFTDSRIDPELGLLSVWRFPGAPGFLSPPKYTLIDGFVMSKLTVGANEWVLNERQSVSLPHRQCSQDRLWVHTLEPINF